MKNQKEKGFRLIKKAEQYSRKTCQLFEPVAARQSRLGLRNKADTGAEKGQCFYSKPTKSRWMSFTCKVKHFHVRHYQDET